MSTERQTVVVTGASSGIGRALVREFARDGYHLVLVARNARTLEEVAAENAGAAAGGKVTVIAADLAQPQGASTLYDELTRAGIVVDVLVNNAGFGLAGKVAELPLERQLDMIQLNVTSLTTLTRLCLPGMVQRRRGGILNVASTAAFQPGPLMAVYYATKAYVLSFTEALADEVEDANLHVTCLCPGPTATGFASTANVTTSRLFSANVMQADEVARIGYDAWKRGQILVIAGIRNRLGAWFVQRLAPRSVVRRAVRKLNAAQ